MVGPEIDARVNSINKAQEMRGQTNTLLCEDLGLKISDSLLILLSAQSRSAVQSGAVVSRQGRQGRTYSSLRSRDGEVFQRSGSPQKRAMFAPRALGRKALPSLWALEIQGIESVTSNC